MNREGVTIVIIEHTMHAMVKLADHFSVLDHGRLIASGTPADVVKEPGGDRSLSRQEVDGSC